MRTRDRGLGLLLTLGACSVFPDEAVLPGAGGAGGSAGHGGRAGQGGSAGSMSGAAASGFVGIGGTLDGGSAGMAGADAGAGLGGASNAGTGGAEGAASGSGGAGGDPSVAPPCEGAVEQRLAAVQDTWLSAESEKANFGSAPTLAVSSSVESEAHAIVAFDLSELPEAMSVGAAALELTLRTSIGETRTLGVYALSRDWREGKASWRAATASDDWSTLGGDTALEPSDRRGLELGVLAGTTIAWDVTADVVADVSAGQPGFGWLVRDTEEPRGRIEFASREAAIAAERPELVILLCP